MTEEAAAGNSEGVSSEGGESAPELFGSPGDLAVSGDSSLSLNEVALKVRDEGNPSISEPQVEQVEPESPEGGKPPRMIRLSDGKEYPASTPIEVNGQKVELGALVDDYIGQSEIHRRFSDFDKQKKAWETNLIENFKQKNLSGFSEFQEIRKAQAEGDYMTVLTKMAELEGKNPIQAKRNFIEQSRKLAQWADERSDEEIDAELAKEEVSWYQKRIQAREQEEQKKSSQAREEELVIARIKQNGLSEQQWAQGLNDIKKNEPDLYREIQELSTQGEVGQQYATDMVADYYHDLSKGGRINSVLNEVAKNHPKRAQLFDEVFRLADRDFSMQDIREVVTEALKVMSGGKSESQSREPSPEGKPEQVASKQNGISQLEPEDALGWDFNY